VVSEAAPFAPAVIADQGVSFMMVRPQSDQGATATEYALLLAGIAVAIVVSIVAFGTFLNTKYTDACNSISTGMNDPAACK
jgi:Flp pilus assembly pilin Flp